MSKRYLFIAVGALFIILIVWLFIESSKPVPGQMFEDEGREHVEIGTSVEYKTNPPTSGKHYADWTRPGVYETPQDDRNLTHSLEHGYIIMSYNCGFKMGWIKTTFAHGLEEESEATSFAESTSSASLSPEFSTDDCHKLVDQLIEIFDAKGKSRLIITPRPNLDARVALTAWRRLEKWNPSISQAFTEDDKNRIEKFIDSFRNQGPEKTME